MMLGSNLPHKLASSGKLPTRSGEASPSTQSVLMGENARVSPGRVTRVWGLFWPGAEAGEPDGTDL